MRKRLQWVVLALLPMLSCIAAATDLRFIQDDFSAARTQALRSNLPIFVECWAPW
jgi:hypothetical protein